MRSITNNNSVPEPAVLQSKSVRKQFEEVEVDKITWKTWIGASLLKLYGLVGESSHYDILHSTRKSCVVRVYSEDKDMFINSFTSYTFSFGNYFGTNLDDADMACHLLLIQSALCMALIISPSLVEVK